MSYPPPQTQQPRYGPPMAQQYGQPYDQQPMAAPVQYGQQPGVLSGGGEWMAIPMQQVPNYPPALAYLFSLDRLVVKQLFLNQQLEMLENLGTANKYKIMNAQGQTIFLAADVSDSCLGNLFGNLRPFDMKIMDNAKNEVIHLTRPLACAGFCFPCFKQSMEVSCPPGSVIGSLEMEWSFVTPKILVKDSSGQTVLKIQIPSCTCGTVEYQVLTADSSTQIGKFYKNFPKWSRALFLDPLTFGITFPLDLDVKIKAVLLAAVFLIDYVIFQTS